MGFRMLDLCYISIGLIVLIQLVDCKKKDVQLDLVTDVKDFKKILRTNKNVLAVISKSENDHKKQLPMLKKIIPNTQGVAKFIFIKCHEEKKLCKKLKFKPNGLDLKHYLNGEFNKDYDRKMSVKSMTFFLSDPTGDLPWEEDESSKSVVHIDNAKQFNKLVKSSKLPLLAMMYAPWCGYCKKLKPEYSKAATELAGHSVLVGVDLDRPDNMMLKDQFNISGYPTLIYFKDGKQTPFGGENEKDGIVEWMKNPTEKKEPKVEAKWSDDTESKVLHLTDDNFNATLADIDSALVMFYAPWCGHCKTMKPEFDAAAIEMIGSNIQGKLIGVDATESKVLAERFGVKGFPTVLYFKNGVEQFKVNERNQDKIVEFMVDPKEPPPPPPPEAEWSETETGVVHLTDESFVAKLKKKKHTLVMFYAPWCGHCKKAKPEYDAASEILADNNKVQLAAVDCTVHTEACKKFDVSGYPTFKYFNYGKFASEYDGGRLKPDFVKFLKDPTAKAVVEEKPKETPWSEEAHQVTHITEQAQFDLVISQKKQIIVMFYAPWCGHCKKAKPEYAEASEVLHGNDNKILAAVDCTVAKDVCSKAGVKGYPTFNYYSNGAFVEKYSSARTSDGFLQYFEDKDKTQNKSNRSKQDIPDDAKKPKKNPPKKQEL